MSVYAKNKIKIMDMKNIFIKNKHTLFIKEIHLVSP